MQSETLLLTWTIAPSNSVRYASASFSPDIRKLQYLKTLIFYITQSNFGKIIFCENSDYKLDKKEIDTLEHLSKLYQKEIELIHFKWDFKKTIKLWYWYGEWECIDYAYDNSKYLKYTWTFYKITWRYIIWNINDIINKHKNCKNLFIRDIPAYFAMNTAFFKIETNIYRTYFYDVKRLVNHWKDYIKQLENREKVVKTTYENACYNMIYKNDLYKINKKLKLMPHRINYYDDNLKWSIHQYNVIKRPKQRYDYIWIRTWIYTISNSDKLFFKRATNFTRK